MNKPKWILRSGVTATECASFPYAFRMAFNMVQRALKNNTSVESTINGIRIVGPPNGKGIPLTYTYSTALNLARSMGLVLTDGTINQKEFKKR